jgi:hypothetical protein
MRAKLGEATAAWEAAETDLARGLTDEFARRKATSALSPAERQRQADLNARLGKIQPLIVEFFAKPSATEAEEEEFAKRSQEREDIENELSKLAAKISQREVASLESIQAALAPDDAIVYWIDSSDLGGDVPRAARGRPMIVRCRIGCARRWLSIATRRAMTAPRSKN